MKGVSLWKGNRKSKDFQFQDRIAKEYVNRSGTGIMVHKYIGPFEQDEKDSSLQSPTKDFDLNELSIQDVLLGEVRDRKYSEDLIEVRGCYMVSESDFDLSQFGYLMSGDTIVLEFHTNDIIEKVGRKFMPGDVLELMHLRDDTSLDATAGVIKKYYVVHDSNRSAGGYGPTWFSHIWRCRCSPIVDTQEYRDILHNENLEDTELASLFMDLGDSDAGVTNHAKSGEYGETQSVASSQAMEMKIRKEHARKEVEKRSQYANHLYIRNSDFATQKGLIEWIYNNDGIPNDFTGDYIVSGEEFPEDAPDGSYFIRSDYSPHRLFKRMEVNGAFIWRKVSDVWREEWSPAGRILKSFIDNDNMTAVGFREDETFREQQALSSVVTPKSKKRPEVVTQGKPPAGK